MLVLYGLTLFLAASLLFLIELMFAKMVLPLLGGTPAVWNTCMLFFQAALLAGYGYAHASVSWLGGRRQIVVHLVLLTLPLWVLPIQVSTAWQPPAEANPILWLLLLLAMTLGLPFFAVSTLGPTLQKWFSQTSHPAARDPYFLYAASNCGSLAGLIGYVALIEPHMTLAQQAKAWAVGYIVLAAGAAACGMAAWRGAAKRALPEAGVPAAAPVGNWRRGRWVALAFVPSSLMLGVTSFLTADVAAVPLLWVVPLGLYLLTFMLVFARKAWLPQGLFIRALPMLVVLQMVLQAGPRQGSLVWVNLLVHLLSFFAAAMVCHGELAQDRPDAGRLTEFYLWLSVGGALGGVFNALVAPVIFSTVAEYPLALVLACLLAPRRRPEAPAFVRLDLLAPLGLGVLAVGSLWGATAFPEVPRIVGLVLLGGLALVCFALAERPVRFGLGYGVVLLASGLTLGAEGAVLHRGRSFFGTYQVVADTRGNYRHLYHGTTLHGSQSLEPGRQGEALTYFHRTGPIGQVFSALAGGKAPRRVAVIGLGTGSLAAYAEAGAEWDFYEIDPAIEKLASDARYFTFLRDAEARGARVRVVLGDARLRLAEAGDAGYDLIVLDAFSGDSVPLHLLTRQAVQLYLRKLAGGGVLAFHISNHYLDLLPAVSALAADSRLTCLAQSDKSTAEAFERLGKAPSRWALLAREERDLALWRDDPRWTSAAAEARASVWTDDFSNILQAIKWK